MQLLQGDEGQQNIGNDNSPFCQQNRSPRCFLLSISLCGRVLEEIGTKFLKMHTILLSISHYKYLNMKSDEIISLCGLKSGSSYDFTGQITQMWIRIKGRIDIDVVQM